jgi:predicted  nucleic acid-binding Zn-ribbon protein
VKVIKLEKKLKELKITLEKITLGLNKTAMDIANWSSKDWINNQILGPDSGNIVDAHWHISYLKELQSPADKLKELHSELKRLFDQENRLKDEIRQVDYELKEAIKEADKVDVAALNF